VTFGLESFAVGVDAKAAIWAKLGVVWRLEPISPNYGKPVVRGVFESVTWVGDVTVWITGEAELVTVRLADGWNVNKHYDLASPGDLEIALDELAALIAQGPFRMRPLRRGIRGGSSPCTGKIAGTARAMRQIRTLRSGS
jgi:hypothetical protein